jgi:hypothetical protein
MRQIIQFRMGNSTGIIRTGSGIGFVDRLQIKPGKADFGLRGGHMKNQNSDKRGILKCIQRRFSRLTLKYLLK